MFTNAEKMCSSWVRVQVDVHVWYRECTRRQFGHVSTFNASFFAVADDRRGFGCLRKSALLCMYSSTPSHEWHWGHCVLAVALGRWPVFVLWPLLALLLAPVSSSPSPVFWAPFVWLSSTPLCRACTPSCKLNLDRFVFVSKVIQLWSIY